jgi:hypothetical protein
MSQGEKEGKKCTSQSKTQKGISLHLAAVSRTTYIDYLQREVAHGSQWHGKGAELLEIDGEKVTRENFILLARGIDPVQGVMTSPETEKSSGVLVRCMTAILRRENPSRSCLCLTKELTKRTVKQ